MTMPPDTPRVRREPLIREVEAQLRTARSAIANATEALRLACVIRHGLGDDENMVGALDTVHARSQDLGGAIVALEQEARQLHG